MTRAKRKVVSEAAKEILALIEQAQAGMPEAEKRARWERFMQSTEPVAERYEKKRRGLAQKPESRAASRGR